MCFASKNCNKIVKKRLKNHWQALVVNGCEPMLAEPGGLCLDFEKTFKLEGQNCVGMKRVNCDGEQIAVVVKRHIRGKSLREIFRSLLPTSKAFRNFRLAVELQKKNIAVVRPLAALQRRKLGRIQESIFITEYKSGRMSLDDFVSGLVPVSADELPKAKRQIAVEITQLLANLHKLSKWHRDSKVANFLVYRDDENKFRVELVDMDGIKPYRLRRDKCQLRTLWKLTESLSRFSIVEQDDYLRGFRTYCDLVEMDKERRKKVFIQVGQMALTKRLLTLAKDTYKSE